MRRFHIMWIVFKFVMPVSNSIPRGSTESSLWETQIHKSSHRSDQPIPTQSSYKQKSYITTSTRFMLSESHLRRMDNPVACQYDTQLPTAPLLSCASTHLGMFCFTSGEQINCPGLVRGFCLGWVIETKGLTFCPGPVTSRDKWYSTWLRYMVWAEGHLLQARKANRDKRPNLLFFIFRISFFIFIIITAVLTRIWLYLVVNTTISILLTLISLCHISVIFETKNNYIIKQ
jgi:hypothetical protein